MIKKIFALIISSIFIFSSIDCISVKNPRQAPPPRRIVVKSAKPGPNYLWINGHWSWKGGRYHWVNGHWMKKKRGKIWISGHWKKKRNRWVWIPGHWR